MAPRILETTNPIYHQRPQVPAGRLFRTPLATDIYDGDFVSSSSRSMARGDVVDPDFRDRLPHEAPTPILSLEPELETRPTGSSLWIADEHPDAQLWHILDLVTGHIFARVRGSLPWVITQVRLAAYQLDGQEQDLYYKMVEDTDAV